jgi:hypothetical protein
MKRNEQAPNLFFRNIRDEENLNAQYLSGPEAALLTH